MRTAGRHDTAVLTALFGVVGAAVVAPWVGSGWLLLLDWVAGPRATLTASAYGLDPAQVDAMPVRVALTGLRHVVGPQTVGWLAIWAFFPIAGTGVARLVGGTRWRQVAAGLLFTVNPFVLDRIRAGHVLLLLGVALLPWALQSFLIARAEGRTLRVRSIGWFALLVSISPHLAWIGGVALLASASWPRPTRRDAARLVVTAVAAAAVSAYALALHLAGVRAATSGPADLAAFATPGATVLERTASHVALLGFWRGGRTPLEVVGPAWWAVVAGMLAVVGFGLRAGWRRSADRPLVATVAVAGVAGLVLAGGHLGLAGPAYRWAFDHLPLFAAMREPQKFLVLTVLLYAVGFGLGVEELAARLVARRATLDAGPTRVGPARLRPAAGAAVVLALPVLLAPNLLWGLGGEVRASRYPASWQQAEQAMGPGTEAVLVLPWHQYQPLSFTDGRTVATPAAAYFTRPVIAGDSAELEGGAGASTSPRSAYVEQLLARQRRIRHLGRLVAPLGVRYVLAIEGGGEAAWLDRQVDLAPVLRADGLALYRVQPSGTGRVSGAVVVAGVDDAIARAESGTGGDAALLVAAPTTSEAGDGRAVRSARSAGATAVAPGRDATGSGGLVARSAVAYDLAPGRSGWAIVPQPASPGWRADRQAGVPTVAGVLAFPVGEEQTVIGYRPWRIVLGGYLVSGLALAVLGALGVVEHRRELLAAVGR